eukprot:gene5698-10947_t
MERAANHFLGLLNSVRSKFPVAKILTVSIIQRLDEFDIYADYQMPIAKEKEVACGEILWHENSLLLAREGIAAHSPPREIPLRDPSIKTGYHAKLGSSSVAQGVLAVIEKRMHFAHAINYLKRKVNKFRESRQGQQTKPMNNMEAEKEDSYADSYKSFAENDHDAEEWYPERVEDEFEDSEEEMVNEEEIDNN